MNGPQDLKRDKRALVPKVERLEGRFLPSTAPAPIIGPVAAATAGSHTTGAHATATIVPKPVPIVGPVSSPSPTSLSTSGSAGLATASDPGSTVGAVSNGTVSGQGPVPGVGLIGVAALSDLGLVAASVAQSGAAIGTPTTPSSLTTGVVGNGPGTFPPTTGGATINPDSDLALAPLPTIASSFGPAGIAGTFADGAFGVGTFTGTGNLVGGTQPSPVTGSTGAGVFSGLDTFGVGSGFGMGFGIQKTPDGGSALY
jgi:hypothetical protein